MRKPPLKYAALFSILLHVAIIGAGWAVLGSRLALHRGETILSIIKAEFIQPKEEQPPREALQEEPPSLDLRTPVKKQAKKTGPKKEASAAQPAGQGEPATRESAVVESAPAPAGPFEQPAPVSDVKEKAAKAVQAPRSSKADEKSIVKKIWGIVNKAAVYPPSARRNGIEGVVKVSFRITKDGRPEKVHVSKSSGYSILDMAALEAVKTGNAYPSIGKPVIIPIRFSLN
ncbi:MAG: energy transducer TonB [Pseudomonadota bacterium]